MTTILIIILLIVLLGGGGGYYGYRTYGGRGLGGVLGLKRANVMSKMQATSLAHLVRLTLIANR